MKSVDIIFKNVGYDGYYGEIQQIVKIVSDEEKAKKYIEEKKEEYLKDIKIETQHIKNFIKNKYSQQEIKEMLERYVYLPFVKSTTTQEGKVISFETITVEEAEKELEKLNQKLKNTEKSFNQFYYEEMLVE